MPTPVSTPLAIAFALSSALVPATSLAQDASVDQMRNSVVKIFSTFRPPSLERPWTKEPPQEATGSGFVIDHQQILTNAHMVEHASQIFIQPPNSSDKLRAEVVAFAGGIDLAIIRIARDSDRAEFHDAHPPLTLDESLPRVGSTVQAIGFPLGGEQQSVTEGVVSRVEFAPYYYNTPALRLQVDAALNPGNSGGPVVMGGKVVGVVFSGIQQAENIGYVIPTEEVLAFLRDLQDGSYDGPPRVPPVKLQTAESPDLRARLALERDQTGLVFTDSDPQSQHLPFQRWDVLDRIGDHDIDNAGLVTLGADQRLGWAYMVPKLARDGSVPVTVLRDGSPVELRLPASTTSDEVIQFLADDYPDYFIHGPLVFTPVYREHVYQLFAGFLAQVANPIATRSGDLRRFEGEQLVVVPGSLLPHPITKGYEIVYYPVLRAVNGVEIRSLAHLVELLRDSTDEYLEFDFYDRSQETLVFRREDLEAATEDVLEDNGIRNRMSDPLRAIWEHR